VSSTGIACGFTLDVLLCKKPDFEGFEGSEWSGVMLGWIVLLLVFVGRYADIFHPPFCTFRFCNSVA
jgi:hypothetical protein